MEKELLTVELSHHDLAPETITIGIYDTIDEAVKEGNKALELLSRYFVARSNDFIVSEVRSFDNMCYVWVVDEGDPATTVTRAFNMGYNVKNMEVKRWNRIIQERA